MVRYGRSLMDRPKHGSRKGGRASRGMRGARCIHCRCRMSICLCDLLPALNSPSMFHFLVDREEELRTTNTGWLARAATSGHWDALGPKETAEVDPDSLLLFPGTSRRLSPRDRGRPIVVVDGTWRRAKARARAKPLIDLPLVALPEEDPSQYQLRHGRRPGRLCTLEAVARSLRALGEPAQADALLDLLTAFVDRTLDLRNGRGPMLEDVLAGISDPRNGATA